MHLKKLLLSSRPISWVNTAFPFAAGYIVASHSVTPVLFIGAVYFLIPYNLLMYGINDVFDYESDLRNPRKGGIEGAVLGRAFHREVVWAAILSNVPFVAALLWLGNPVAAAALVGLLFFVIAYSAPILRFKERPIIDSITSSIHFAGPLVYALALVGFRGQFVPYILAFFLWGMASHAFGAVQDIVADKSANIGSIATVLGARPTVWFAALLYAASSILVMLQGTGGLIVGLAGLAYLANVAPFLMITEARAEQANRGWRRFIWLNLAVGFVVTMVLILKP